MCAARREKVMVGAAFASKNNNMCEGAFKVIRVATGASHSPLL